MSSGGYISIPSSVGGLVRSHRAIPKDYLRALRPLRALRAMLVSFMKDGHLKGKAATPNLLVEESNYLRVLRPFLCILRIKIS